MKNSIEAKIQTSANLANFAYDPINFGHLRRNGVPELYLENLAATEDALVLNGIAGICNLCLGNVIKCLQIKCVFDRILFM